MDTAALCSSSPLTFQGLPNPNQMSKVRIEYKKCCDGKEYYVIYISVPGKSNKIVIKLEKFYPFKAPHWYFQKDKDILELKKHIHDVLGVSAVG